MMGVNSLLLFTLPAASPLRPIALLMMAFEFSALVWNANPLLPFDGYLVLADILREPNLRKSGLTLVKNSVRRLFGRDVTPVNHSPRQRALYVAYGVLASLYIVSLISYFWLLSAMNDPLVRKALLQHFPILSHLVAH
jgi:hypothetical protein